ncbi:hypothetical protein BJ165DRAFT_1440337 [Panaeolus papilionaceus]|nr:hypothetical protein BJ165DRAFT_1440337 [Panaeolus papilionaceus]
MQSRRAMIRMQLEHPLRDVAPSTCTVCHNDGIRHSLLQQLVFVPHELSERILQYLRADVESLLNCALACRS